MLLFENEKGMYSIKNKESVNAQGEVLGMHARSVASQA